MPSRLSLHHGRASGRSELCTSIAQVSPVGPAQCEAGSPAWAAAAVPACDVMSAARCLCLWSVPMVTRGVVVWRGADLGADTPPSLLMFVFVWARAREHQPQRKRPTFRLQHNLGDQYLPNLRVSELIRPRNFAENKLLYKNCERNSGTGQRSLPILPLQCARSGCCMLQTLFVVV